MSRAAEKRAKKSRPLTDADVARFLKSLAAVYRDKRVGNLPLSEALIRVAEKLILEASSLSSTSEDVQRRSLPQLSISELQSLKPEDVSRFILDDLRTKLELIELAAARFSIPRARLLRLRMDEVRDAIRSSLQHEDSLKIITEQAEQNGGTRRS